MLRELMRINSKESLTAISKVEIGGCSIADIRKFETPPISALVKNKDKSECYQLIKLFIVQVNQFLGIAWNDFQMVEVAKEFYSRYFYWHQLDLKKFFQMCKHMEFERLLSVNQFSPMMLMSWAAIYDEKWIQVSEEIRDQEHDKHSYDAARETEIYKKEVRLKVDKRTDQEVIENLRYALDRLKNNAADAL